MSDPNTDVSDWWRTSIIDMAPGQIRMRGEPIEEMIGAVTFPEMIWLMVMGTRPSEAEAKLLEAALVAAVDHGPQAPSIATARMAVTCGADLNGAMASAVNMLDDVHGGAGQQAHPPPAPQQAISTYNMQACDAAAAHGAGESDAHK